MKQSKRFDTLLFYVFLFLPTLLSGALMYTGYTFNMFQLPVVYVTTTFIGTIVFFAIHNPLRVLVPKHKLIQPPKNIDTQLKTFYQKYARAKHCAVEVRIVEDESVNMFVFMGRSLQLCVTSAAITHATPGQLEAIAAYLAVRTTHEGIKSRSGLVGLAALMNMLPGGVLLASAVVHTFVTPANDFQFDRHAARLINSPVVYRKTLELCQHFRSSHSSIHHVANIVSFVDVGNSSTLVGKLLSMHQPLKKRIELLKNMV
jgi:hypothetical protein